MAKIKFIRTYREYGAEFCDIVYESGRLVIREADKMPDTARRFIITATKKTEIFDKTLNRSETIYENGKTEQTAPKTPEKIEQLAAALIRAKEAAAVYQNSEDGGTCNLDSPTLYYKKSGDPAKIGKSAELTTKDVEKAVELAGMTCWKWNLYKSACYVVNGWGSSGQANRRSRMAEAFRDSLRADGYGAGMYYAMD